MQCVSQKLTADLENRTAFLVQVRALLMQAQNIMKGNQKGKLQEMKLCIEEWINEVGTSSPTLSKPTPDPSVAPMQNQDQDQEQQQQQQPEPNTADGKGEAGRGRDGSRRNSDTSRSPSNVPQTAVEATTTATMTAATAPLITLTPPRGDEPSPPAVDIGDSLSNGAFHSSASNLSALSSDFDCRNLEDFAEFLSMFFSSGLQEIVKLRSIGRNAARLVIVRCFSIITCALQQVVRQVYCETNGVGEVNTNAKGENSNSPSTFFSVFLSRDIRVSTNAIRKCLELLTAHTDALSMRFAAQVCVDILKQLRLCVTLFVCRALRGELRHLHTTVVDATNRNFSPQEVDKMHEHAKKRVEELRRLIGPSLLNSVEHLMSLVRPAVRYLMSVASLKESVATPEERALKNDACINIFGLSEWVTPSSCLKLRKRQQTLEDGEEREREGERREEEVTLSRLSDIGALGLASSDVESIVPGNPRVYQAAYFVVDSLFPVAFSLEYIACVAQHCGDQNEGQLAAVRVLKDTVKNLTTTNIEEFRHVFGVSAWRKRVMEGILSCLVSLNAIVLEAGLETLHRIVVGCPDSLGSEVGFVYTSGVFGLLEADSTSHVMKRVLLQHVISTFFTPSSVVGEPSLLLRLYEHFDLNVRWHQLNVIQQAIASLSKTVRRATPEEFADEEEVRNTNNNGGGSQEPAVVARKSLPFLALKGLSLAVGLLAMHIPRDVDSSGMTTYPRLPNRDEKMAEQRALDVINSSPLKGLKKWFGITDEEMSPSEHEKAAEHNWAHQDIPLPASAKTEAKIHSIVQFLKETPSLNPESVAEFLSHPAVFPLQVCRVFMESLPIAGKSLLDGLKELFSLIQLPKEGQRIERLLEFFCSAYYKLNSVAGVDVDTFPFESENACFITGVAILMLNTNLHNPQVSSAKMTDAGFYAQLRGCNEGKDFPSHFTKNIFDEINLHSLASMKGFWSAGMSRGSHYATVPLQGKMDSFFFSSEERRELAFGVVRQRLLSETRELIYRRSRIETSLKEATPTFWSCVTQDLFLSTWPSLCAVFGAAAHGPKVPEETLALCVMGLRSSFLVSAAFGLQTECGVSQLELLRMASYETMRNVCHKSILEVAASPHSLSFSAIHWVPVVKLLVTIHDRQQTMLQEAEGVFGRVEELTCEACVEDNNSNTSNNNNNSSNGGGSGGMSTNASILSHGAVQEVLRSVASLLQEISLDGKTLSGVFYVLKRFLGYSLISHEKESETVVTNFINVRDFTSIILPTLLDVVEVRRGKGDESLHLLMEFIVDILSLVWSSDVCDVKPSSIVQHLELIPQCFAFFQDCYERCGVSADVRMHVLQGVKELIARMLHKVGSTKVKSVDFDSQTLYTMALIWIQLLQPVTRVLSDKDTVGTETCSLAVHILRKLVVLSCGETRGSGGGGGGAAVGVQLPKKVQSILLLLLSDVAYIGGICSDVDSAQSCLTQLSTICATALNHDGTNQPEPEPSFSLTDADKVMELSFIGKERSFLLQCLVDNVQKQPDVLLLHALERMTLLLCSHTQQTRTDVITTLRGLIMQLEPPQLQHLAVHLSDAVLESSLGHATPDYKPSATDPGFVSYRLFGLRIPSTMRKCSPTSFRATLPLVLNFISQELLSEVPLKHMNSVAELVMNHCLVPLIISVRSSFQIRTTAVRFLMQCASLCVTRQAHDGGGESCSQIIVECVSLLLFGLRVPVQLVVPDAADHAGREWVKEEKSEVLTAYMRSAAVAIQDLWTAESYEVTGSRRGAMFSAEGETNAQVEPEEMTRTMRGTWSSPLGDVATDEQLVEYCSLMAQLLSPLPKVLAGLPPHVFKRENGDNRQHSQEKKEGEKEGEKEDSTVWMPPPAHHTVLAELVLEAVGVFFAILWRVNNVAEMESFMTRATQKGRDAPSLCKSNALLPHAAVRGGLNAFLALAVWVDIAGLRGVFLEILRITATVQTSTLTVREAQKMADGTAEAAIIQRLSPQEQQHIRSCNVGMYQELSSVVLHWIKTIINQTNAETSMLTNTQQERLQCAAGDSEVFEGVVRLLIVTAGAVIVAIRDYLVWYISLFHHGMNKTRESPSVGSSPEMPQEQNNIPKQEG